MKYWCTACSIRFAWLGVYCLAEHILEDRYGEKVFLCSPHRELFAGDFEYVGKLLG